MKPFFGVFCSVNHSSQRMPGVRNSLVCLISYIPQRIKPVIPAKAGIQPELGIEHWIPAFAGMTEGRNV